MKSTIILKRIFILKQVIILIMFFIVLRSCDCKGPGCDGCDPGWEPLCEEVVDLDTCDLENGDTLNDCDSHQYCLCYYVGDTESTEEK